MLKEGPDTLVTMLNLQEVEASPVLTTESDLYDPDSELRTGHPLLSKNLHSVRNLLML